MPRQTALMGVDLGTTATKVGLFDAQTGAVLGLAASEYRTRSPHPDWVELEVEAYWRATVSATRAAMAQADCPEVRGIGLSSQGQTFAPLDASLKPLRPALVWLDTRAQEQAQRLREALDPAEFTRRTGLVFPSAVDSAPKMMWLREHEPDVWGRTRYLVMLPDYIGLRLTGKRRLDIGNASSTGLADQSTVTWWPQALEAAGVPAEWLSPLGKATELVGSVTAEAAAELDVPQGIPVALGANDQTNGAIGVGNVEPGIASGTMGTAMAIMSTVTPDRTGVPGLLRARHPVEGLWLLCGYAKTSCILLTWLRDLLAPQATYETLLAEAATIAPGCDGLGCLPHFSGVATPTFRSDVRGAFVGLTLGHGRAHLTRAVAEAVCFGARDALELVARAGETPRALRMLGGATRSAFWMQMLADVTGMTLEIPACTEAPVAGAAIFAGVAAGLHGTIVDAARTWYQPQGTYNPRAGHTVAYQQAYATYRERMGRLYPGALG